MSAWSDQIEFDEYIYDDEFDTTILCFKGPKELLEDINNKDIGSEIRIEYAYHGAPEDPDECDIMIGHVIEENNVIYNRDWNYYDITKEQYKDLIDIYLSRKGKYE